jgi:hypothetical protein
VILFVSIMKKCLSGPGICALLLMLSCTSQVLVRAEVPLKTEVPSYSGKGVSLDEALSGIAAYYAGNLSANSKIALVNFDSPSRLLSDYILEELSIHFEDKSSFTLVDRQNLALIERELEYQETGMVSDESAQSIGRQLGAQTLVYGKITPLGGEYRLVVHATDVERAVTSIRSAAVVVDKRFAALPEKPPEGTAAVSMANALYSDTDNP